MNCISPFLNYVGLGGPRDASFVGGGGGGGALGDATIWPTVTSWADLSLIPSPRDGDQALVFDPATLGGVMYAQFNQSNSTWEFFLGEFFIFDAMFLFPHPIQDNATAIFSGRSFAWTYLQGVDLTDQYRWLPNDVAAGSPFLRGYAIGDESSEAQLLTQGVEKYENGGTFTTSFLTDGQGPFIRMDGYSPTAIVSGGFFASGSNVTTTTKVYQRLMARTKGPASGNWNIPYFAHQVSPGRTIRWAANNGGTLVPVNNTLATVGSLGALTQGGGSFGVTYKVWEFIDEGQIGGCRVYVDGVFYGQFNRTAGSNRAFIADGGNSRYGLGSVLAGADLNIGMDFKDLIMMEF